MPVTLFLSPSTLYRSKEHLLALLPDARVYCDSSTLHRLLRLRGVNVELGSFDLSETIGIARSVFERARRENRRLLAVGGTAEDAERFRHYLLTEHGLSDSQVVTSSGYHSDVLQEVMRLVEEVRPDDVVLGLGAPTQERLARHCVARFPQVEFYTCGGFITQTALSGGRFYPPFFDRIHARWLYRIFRQPYVIKRLLNEYVPGYWLALRLGRRLHGANRPSGA
jgi:UDP-N-acetyl-D-mannosaminuronic acid transferase (WecB/TagA/CpsF family)